MKLTVISNTIFKKRPKSSRELSQLEKQRVMKGTEFDVVETTAAPLNHLRVVLEAAMGTEPEMIWYVFSDHVALLGNEPNNNPQEDDDPTLPQDYPDGFTLPGYAHRFYLPDPVLKGGNFTWAEVTKNGQRLPTSKAVVDNILRMAETMQDIRELMEHRPIKVTSWYRDRASNQKIGASRRSFHLTGQAVDFYVSGVSPADIQKQLGPWWGSQGGLASARGFTHIDNRGYRARWRYGL